MVDASSRVIARMEDPRSGTTGQVSMTGIWLWCSCFDDETIKLVKSQDGMRSLYEKEHIGTKLGCGHILGVMKKNLDVNAAGPMQGEIAVPIAWSEAASFHVILHVTPDKNMRSVWLPDGDHTLGYVGNQDGRRALRSIYAEFLRGQYRRLPACSNEHHGRERLFGPVERKKLDADSKDPVVLRSIHTMLFSEECWTCYTRDDSDLIPNPYL